MKVALGQPTMPPYANGPSHLRGKEKFQKAAHHELNDVTKRRNYQYATTTIRVKRQAVVDEVDDWQDLREAGSTIKRDVASRMPELLEQFEENVTKRGGHVHWARDSKEANEIIQDLVRPPARTRLSRSSPWPPRKSR